MQVSFGRIKNISAPRNNFERRSPPLPPQLEEAFRTFSTRH